MNKYDNCRTPGEACERSLLDARKLRAEPRRRNTVVFALEAMLLFVLFVWFAATALLIFAGSP